MKSLCPFAIVLLCAGCSDTAGTPDATPPAARSDAEGFVSIGADDLEFYAIGKDEPGGVAMSEVDGVISFKGNVRNYAYTQRPYKNFTLRLDVRWPNAAELPEEDRPNANTGVLVFITGEHKIWPKCLEVQGKWSELCHIKSNAKDVTVTVRDDEDARQQARKPVGEWNSVEIVAKDGALTSTLNGTKIAESDPTELAEGPIGFQAERYDVEFRNVRIREE
ncbi:MAG: DUF1080 domain-containing protein [Planctomycetaceae bacterium]